MPRGVTDGLTENGRREEQAMDKTWRMGAVLAMACAMMGLGDGCVALPVGHKSFREEWAGESRRAGAGRAVSASVDIRAEGRGGGRVAVGLKGTVEMEWKRERPVYRVEVSKWKWISAGAFPGMAEKVYRTKRTLRPMFGEKYSGNSLSGIGAPATKASGGGILLSWLFCTPFAVPFELLGVVDHECESHHWEGTNAVLLTKFSSGSRKKIGAWTWWDDPELVHQRPVKSGYSHYMLVGFHRYCTYTVSDKTQVGTKEAVPERRSASWSVTGPYEVELTIKKLEEKQSPDCKLKQEVQEDGGEAVFELPRGVRGRVELKVKVLVSDRRLADEENEFRRAVLEKANGTMREVVVTVRE